MERERTYGSLLVVADDPELRRKLSVQLIGAEYRVHGASNGYEALDQMATRPVDLVVTDYQMSMMDGMELLSIIRLRWPGIPVVVISREPGDLVQQQAVEQGAMAWIRKGCDSNTLLDVVAMALPQSIHF
jgi:CheY-like chemotaxis protein